jgi:hypothetical protein
MCISYSGPYLIIDISHREKQLAKSYWDKLFKEYCIADLSRYKENKVISLKESFRF